MTYEDMKTSHKKVREKVEKEMFSDSIKLAEKQIVRTASMLLQPVVQSSIALGHYNSLFLNNNRMRASG